MYYIIRDSGVDAYKNMKEINKKSDVAIPQEDFKALGGDFIVYLNESDISFCQDAKKLSNLALNKLFKADSTPKIIMYIILALSVFNLLKG